MKVGSGVDVSVGRNVAVGMTGTGVSDGTILSVDVAEAAGTGAVPVGVLPNDPRLYIQAKNSSAARNGMPNKSNTLHELAARGFALGTGWGGGEDAFSPIRSITPINRRASC